MSDSILDNIISGINKQGKYERILSSYLLNDQGKEIKEIPKPLPTGDLSLYIPQWDYNYINNLSLEETIELLNAAQILDINDLINLASAKIGSEMLNGTVEEVLDKFTIKDNEK